MNDWFFERINKIDKSLAIIINKRGKAKMHAMRSKKGETTTDSEEIQKIVNNYFENLYLHRLENTEEMGRFLEAYELPNLKQEDTKILNDPILINKIEN